MNKLVLVLLMLIIASILLFFGIFFINKTQFGCEVLKGGKMQKIPNGCYPSCPMCMDCNGRGPVENKCITL